MSSSSKERKKKKGSLHEAIEQRDFAGVCSLVEQRPDINALLIFDTFGCYADMKAHPQGKDATPLLAAIHMGAVDMCKYLIEEGADPNWGYVDGMGPLCLALNHKHYEIAELLIESGANVHAPDRHGIVPINHAIEKNSPVSVVKAIISAGVSKDAVMFNDGIVQCRPLTKAIRVNNVPVVKYFLDTNVDFNSRTAIGTTPLLLAMSLRSPEIVKLLIGHGANVEGISMDDAPPLFMAVEAGDTTMIQILIEAGADVNRYFNPSDYALNITPLPQVTALQLASLRCHYSAMILLLNHGADLNARIPILKGTVLHFVFHIYIENLSDIQRSNHRKIVRHLLEIGADTKIKDKDGKLPLHYILISKNWIALEEYVKLEAYIDETVRQRYGSILRFVISNKIVHLAELCLSYGANCFEKFHGNPIYYDVIKSDSPEILRLFWKYNYPFDDNVPEKLLKHSPRVSSLLHTQKSFMGSIISNDPETVEQALKLGASVNCHYKDGGLPLHVCSVRGDSDLVKILLKNGANVFSVSIAGYSVLHLAAKFGHLEVCKLLLRHGACLDYIKPGGSTPCQLAQLAGHKKVVLLLQEISRYFSLLKKKNPKVVDIMKSKFIESSSEEFSVYLNCVNRRGNTLLGEALRLNLTDIGASLMALRLKVL